MTSPENNLPESATLLINKPLDWTSFQVVNKLKYAIKNRFGLKKFKIGHAGTLDPKATGLLIICVGKMTKEIEGYQAQEKVYSGSFFLGATTPCYDTERPIDQEYPWQHISKELIEQTKTAFIGAIEQVPPVFSALKVNGKAMYLQAHKGEEQEAPKPRNIEIYDLEFGELDGQVLPFRVRCSKGTYVRSLAHDFGKALGSGGYLLSLHREKIGNYSVTEAFSIDEFIGKLNPHCSFLSLKS
jgi:tRNA pseudouridine55 synthase